MTAGKSLKQQNAWLVRAALVIHGAAFAYVVLEPLPIAQISEPVFMRKMQEFLAPGSLALALIALTKLVLLGVLPAHLRDCLIHWRVTNPLPGARAFTKIGPADPRVDMQRLAKRYGPLPSEPEKQNRLFYSVYKKQSDDVGVLDAHRSYLAARDIGTINLLLFFLLAPLAVWFSLDAKRAAIYATILLLAYVLMCVAAQAYGQRLVQNALAVASRRST